MKKEDIHCPICSKENTWRDDNPSRPFCSARCKLIDLGDWAAEQHRIPAEEKDDFQKPASDVEKKEDE